jgi:hypothetical protein
VLCIAAALRLDAQTNSARLEAPLFTNSALLLTLRDVKIERLGFGKGIGRRYQKSGGGAGEGYVNTGEYDAPAIETLLQNGFPSR